MAEIHTKSETKSDVNSTTDSNQESVASTTPSNNKSSIECLHESKPAPNISINATIYENSEESAMSIPSTKESIQSSPAKIETVFEKLSMVTETTEPSDVAIVSKSSEIPATKSKSKKDNSKMSNIDEVINVKEADESGTHIWRNNSSTGKMNKQRDFASNVFPVGCMGCKDEAPYDQTSPRRFLDAKEASQDYTGHIDSTPRKRPSSAKPQNNRNPLTGAGIEEDTRKTSNRKKGNNCFIPSSFYPCKTSILFRHKTIDAIEYRLAQ